MQGINLSFNEQSINKLKQQFDSLIKELGQKGKVSINVDKVNEDIQKIKLQLNSVLTGKPIDLRLNTAQVESDLKKTVNNIDEAIKHYEKLGKVSTSNRKYDDNGNLSSFVLELSRADGLLEKINYKASAFQDIGGGKLKGVEFSSTNITELDKTAKVIEKIAKDQEKLDNAMYESLVKDASDNLQREFQLKTKLINAGHEETKIINEQLSELKSKNALILQQLKLEDLIKLKKAEVSEQDKYDIKTASQLDVLEKSKEREQQRVTNLGEFKTNVDSSVFGKSTDELEKYIKTLYDTDVQVTKLQKSTDGLGKSTISMSVKTKEGKHNFTEEKLVIDEVTGAIYRQNQSLKESHNHMGDFSSQLKMMFQHMIQFSAISAAFYGAINQIKEGIQFTNELNKSQTNIQMIAGYSREQVQGLTKDYSKLADELYSTTDAVMKGAEEFLRAGNNIEETRSLLKASTIGSAVSGQTNQEMAEQLIAISNGFKMATGDAKEMMDVIDTLSTLDNSSATSMKEIAEAMTRTSSSAQMAGVSFKDMATYIATVSSVSRKSASSIGESFKSIFARYQNVKGGMKFDADNDDLSNVERDLQKYAQISIRSDKGTFKEFDNVMDELAKKWKNLSQVSQSAIAKALAGTMQRENFLILMNNLDQVNELQQKVADAAGSSQKKFDEAYGQSTEAKINKLKNSMQTFYMSVFNSDAINSAIGGLTTLVQYLDVIATTSSKSAIELIAFSTAVLLVVKNLTSVKAAFSMVSIVFSNFMIIASRVGVVTAMAEAFTLLGTAIKGVTVALLTNPWTWAIAAIGVATVAFMKHINHQKELKAQTEELTSSYKNLNEAIKNADMASVESSSKSLGDTQTKLQDAINKKIEAENRIKEIQEAVFNGDGGAGMAQTYQDELTGLNSMVSSSEKIIKELTKTLKDSGVEFDSATGEIYKYSQAQSLLKNNQIASDIRKQAEESYNNRQEIIALINEYQNLSAIENANATEKQRMSQIAQELQGSIQGLSVIRDTEGNYIIQNTKLLGTEIDMLNKEGQTATTLANVKLTAAKQEASIEIGKTRMTYLEAKKRIGILQKEAAAYKAAAQQASDAGINMGVYEASNAEIGQIEAALSALDKIYSVGSANIGVSPLSTKTSSYTPSGSKSAEDAKKAAEDAAREAERLREEALQNVKDVESEITEIIKRQVEERKKAIQDEFDARKKALQREQDLYNETNEENDYQRDLRREQETLANIDSQITDARRDTTLSGRARLNELEAQRREQQEAINQMIEDRTRELNNDRFDNEMQNLDNQMNSQLDALDQQYSEENISRMVNSALITGQLRDVNGGLISVTNAFVSFQNRFENGLTASGRKIQEEFIDKWQQVQRLINGTAGVDIGINFRTLPMNSYAVGTPLLSSDQIAQVHRNEAIIPAESNPFRGGQYLTNFLKLLAPNLPNVSPMNRNNPIINFNEPLVNIQGGINSDIDVTSMTNAVADRVTRRIMQSLNDDGVYAH